MVYVNTNDNYPLIVAGVVQYQLVTITRLRMETEDSKILGVTNNTIINCCAKLVSNG